MAITHLDTAAVARVLARLVEDEGESAEAYFERIEEACLPAEGRPPGFQVWREEGLALRFLRGDRIWSASRDVVDGKAFAETVRQVARALPAAPWPEPELDLGPWWPLPTAEKPAEFGLAVSRAIRERHVAFPLELEVRAHRRWVQVVGTRFVPGSESEHFYSLRVALPWGHWGALVPTLDEPAVEAAALALVGRFRSRHALSPEARSYSLVLAPPATAVLLHEAVAHALEADTLAASGRPESAIGLPLGAPCLHVVDAPGHAPETVRRSSDDEGVTVARRWLLRAGIVEAPLADLRAAGDSGALLAGAGRRPDRHGSLSPRTYHLELLPGETSARDLVGRADGGLWIPEISSGQLDPATGRFQVEVPWARRIRGGQLAEPVGRFCLRATVAGFLGSVRAVGSDMTSAGAGWCAKGGQRLPVWATAPSMWVDSVEVAG